MHPGDCRGLPLRSGIVWKQLTLRGLGPRYGGTISPVGRVLGASLTAESPKHGREGPMARRVNTVRDAGRRVAGATPRPGSHRAPPGLSHLFVLLVMAVTANASQPYMVKDIKPALGARRVPDSISSEAGAG